MDYSRIEFLSFTRVVWIFPIAYALHVLEELPRFTSWATQYANTTFTMRDYLMVHIAGLVVAVVAPLILRFFPIRIVVFLFFTFIFTPAAFFNIIFHVGATAFFGVYCPGLLTAISIYPVTFFVISQRAFKEGLITERTAVISFVLAGLFHVADVSHNVFKAW